MALNIFFFAFVYRVSTSFAELSAESEEDSPHSVASTAVGVKRHNQSSSSPTR